MEKNYNYKRNTLYLGDSDIACILARGYNKMQNIAFGGDASYRAYLIDARFEIPSHYSLVFECECWIHFIDEFSINLKIYAEKIQIFRAGEMGCLIRVEGLEKISQLTGSAELPDFKKDEA